MIKEFIEINKILTLNEKKKLFLLTVYKFFLSFADMIAILSIAPFLLLLTNDSKILNNEYYLLFKSLLNINDKESIVILGLFSIFFFIINNLFKIFLSWYENSITQYLVANLSNNLFNYYLNKDYIFHINNNPNYLLQRILVQTNSSVAGVISPFFQILGNILTVLFLSIILFFISTKIILLLLLICFIFYVFNFYLVKNKIDYYGKIQKNFSEITFEVVSQAFKSIKFIKITKSEKFYLDLFYPEMAKMAKSSVAISYFSSIPKNIIEITAISIFYGIIFILLFISSKNLYEITVILGIFLASLQKILPSLQAIYHQFSIFKFYRFTFYKIYKDLSLSSRFNNKNEVDLILPKKKFKKISFKGVKFSYGSSNNINIIINNLSISRSEIIGISGRIGSGKSTFLDLLTFLIKPSQGKILLDGKTADKNSILQWQDNISYVSQNSLLINGSIKNNIAFSTKEEFVDYKKIDEVCRAVNMYSFINNKLPLKYNTNLGESGIKLSGGQRQSILIARALYRVPDLLIIDEATNSLDIIAENLIIDYLFKKKISLIMVSHKIKNLKRCDKIIFFEKGKLVDIGSYNKLLFKNKKFRSLHEDFN